MAYHYHLATFAAPSNGFLTLKVTLDQPNLFVLSCDYNAIVHRYETCCFQVTRKVSCNEVYQIHCDRKLDAEENCTVKWTYVPHIERDEINIEPEPATEPEELKDEGAPQPEPQPEPVLANLM